MEKFTKWEDKSCGINPFVPFKRRPKSIAIVPFAGLLAAIRMLLLLPLTLAVFAMAAFEPLLLVSPAKWLFRRIVLMPLTRMVLLVMGYLSISEQILDSRRLRMGKLSQKGLKDSEAARKSFAATVRSGDILIFNHTSIVEVLYAYSRFGCKFAIVSLPDGNSLQIVSLIGALQRAAWAGMDPKAAPGNPETGKGLTPSQAAKIAAKDGCPLMFLPEGVRTNGNSIIRFAPVIDKDPSLFELNRLHVFGVEYSYSSFSPCNTVSGIIPYVYWTCFQGLNRMSVNSVPHELRTAETAVRTSTSTNNESAEQTDSKLETGSAGLRSLLALAIGNRGVKRVELGIPEYFSFQEYFNENSSVKKKQ